MVGFILDCLGGQLKVQKGGLGERKRKGKMERDRERSYLFLWTTSSFASCPRSLLREPIFWPSQRVRVISWAEGDEGDVVTGEKTDHDCWRIWIIVSSAGLESKISRR